MQDEAIIIPKNLTGIKPGDDVDDVVSVWKMAAFSASSFALLMVFWLLPRGEFLIVMTNPALGASHAMDVIGKANGEFVEAGRFPWIATVYSSDENFAARLMAAGALLVFENFAPNTCLKRVTL